jgi:hypothetical protein
MESALLFMGGLREVPDVTKSKDIMEWRSTLKNVLEKETRLTYEKNLYNRHVSRREVLNALKEVANFLKHDGKRIAFIYYYGHGNQVKDYNGDESDGKDEYWALYGGGNVLDDEISEIFKHIPKHSKLILWSDSCSSGTMIDRPLNSANWITYTSCRDCQDALTTFDGGVATIWAFMPILKECMEKREYIPKIYYAKMVERLKIMTQHMQFNYGNEEVIQTGWFE